MAVFRDKVLRLVARRISDHPSLLQHAQVAPDAGPRVLLAAIRNYQPPGRLSDAPRTAQAGQEHQGRNGYLGKTNTTPQGPIRVLSCSPVERSEHRIPGVLGAPNRLRRMPLVPAVQMADGCVQGIRGGGSGLRADTHREKEAQTTQALQGSPHPKGHQCSCALRPRPCVVWQTVARRHHRPLPL